MKLEGHHVVLIVGIRAYREHATRAIGCIALVLDGDFGPHGVARKPNAKSSELRAATSLARPWQSQGKSDKTHNLFAPVFHWFTEGFGTPDLTEAKALLDKLK